MMKDENQNNGNDVEDNSFLFLKKCVWCEYNISII